jgi:predicted nucleic acid-binding protein
VNRGILADTGPLYAAVDIDDQHHHRAQRELERAEQEGSLVVISHPVLLEAYTLILRRLGIRAAHTWIDDVLGGSALQAASPDDYFEAARTVRSFDDQPLTLVDAVLAQLALRLGTPVWTYDHHFDLMGVSVWR